MKAFFIFTLLILASLPTTSHAAFLPAKVATGIYSTCALSTEGKVKCWGYNNTATLGTGNYYHYGLYPNSMGKDLPTARLGTDVKVVDICVGSIHACAVTTTGKVKCWGQHYDGALGQGDFLGPTIQMDDSLKYSDLGSDFYAKKISCSSSQVCALSDKGKAKCWGFNHYAELATGDTIDRGNKPNQMGDNLPYLTTSKPIKAVVAGYNYSCAQFDDGIKCWGQGENGVLGQENPASLGGTAATKDLDRISPIKLEAPGANIKIRKITAGSYPCVLYEMDNTDRIKCWGKNYYGQLGVGNTNTYGKDPGTMGEKLPPIDLGFGKIADIQSHAGTTCALDYQGKIKCWGFNEVGQLGLGDKIDRGASPNQMGASLPQVDLGLPVKSLSSGYGSHNCAILINSTVKCWGYGVQGQLGYEEGLSRGGLPDQLGEALPFVRLD